MGKGLLLTGLFFALLWCARVQVRSLRSLAAQQTTGSWRLRTLSAGIGMLLVLSAVITIQDTRQDPSSAVPASLFLCGAWWAGLALWTKQLRNAHRQKAATAAAVPDTLKRSADDRR
jgi:hypothetical protein